MRALLLALAAFGLTACSQFGAGQCDVTVRRDLSFSHRAAQEHITARAFGQSCDKAIGLYTIHDTEGYPLWSWSIPLSRAFGEETFQNMTREEMRDFLTRWAQPSISSTQSAPPWEALTYGQTTLDRLTYDDIRARDLPMLCHSSGTARELCVFWEPAAGGAGLLLERTLEDSAT